MKMLMMFGAGVGDGGDFILAVVALRSPHRNRFRIQLWLLTALADGLCRPFFIFWLWMLLLMLHCCCCHLSIVVGHRRLHLLVIGDCAAAGVVILPQQ